MRFCFAIGSLYTYAIDRCVALGVDGVELMIDRRREPANQGNEAPRFLDCHTRRIIQRVAIGLTAQQSIRLQRSKPCVDK